MRARAACALVEDQPDEGVDDAVQVLAAVALAGPVRVERVEAEDAEHRPDLGEPGDRRFLVVGGEGGVALPDGGVHDRERLRDAQVVVHRLGEGGRHLGGGLDAPPAFSTTRCTKPSIRANADSASRRASSLYSIIER